MSLFFKSPLDIEIKYENEDKRPTIDTKLGKGNHDLVPIYDPLESVCGTVTIRPLDGRKVEHTGIRVQFLGCIEHKSDKSNGDEFLAFSGELAAPGEIRHAETFSFEFKNVHKQYESYNGQLMRLRYFIRVTVARRLNDVVREKDLWVLHYTKDPPAPTMIKIDVGIEDCLHIEFEYSKQRYHLDDVVVGRIVFLLVRLKIKHTELNILRTETYGSGPGAVTETSTLVRFEIMDGSPVKHETIPIRLFLEGFDLVPTMRDVNKKFSVQTFLSLLLVDEQNRRYFKKSEIILYRREPEA